MTRWKTALLAACVFFTGNVMACSCIDNPIERLYALADSVFVAKLTKAELIDSSDRGEDFATKGHYEVVELFKGSPPRHGPLFDAELQSGNCSVGLLVGAQYVFFADENMKINQCNGTRQLNTTESLEFVDKIRALSKME